jgi:hypothetical protein
MTESSSESLVIKHDTLRVLNSEKITPNNEYILTPEQYLKMLTPEQRDYITGIEGAMAEKFGVDREEIGIVMEEELEKWTDSRFTYPIIMYTGKYGLQRGSYEDIMDTAKTPDYTIDISGEGVDTRNGMTKNVYERFVLQTDPEDDGLLPDTEPDGYYEAEDGDPNAPVWPKTILTGEPCPTGMVKVGYDEESDDQPNFEEWDLSDSGNTDISLRFRPAVSLKNMALVGELRQFPT